VQTGGDKPDIRYGHGVTLDETNHRLVVSHGFARDGRHDDTWALDLGTLAWQDVTPQGEKPEKRCLHDIAYAPTAEEIYLYGGCSSGFGPCPQGDLWTLDVKSGVWEIKSPSGEVPSARENPAIAINTRTGNLILFGGKDDAAVNDLWEFSTANGTWRQVEAEGPSGRNSHDAIYDAAHNRLYVFGGKTADGASDELWMLQF
jgi:hypothetical protein